TDSISKLKQAGLVGFCIVVFPFPGERRKRNECAHLTVERPADCGRMHFKWAVAKHIEGYSFFEPLYQLLCPLTKKWLVHFHTRMADVAKENKVSRSCNLEREVGLAFARLKYLLLCC